MQQIKTFFVFLFIAVAATAHAQQDTSKMNCSILKNVKFKYLDIEDSTAFVIIKGNKHIEYHDNQKYYIKSDIAWVNDCEYNMTMTKITIPNFPFRPGDVMNVKITKMEGDIVYCTSTVKGSGWKGRFRILKD